MINKTRVLGVLLTGSVVTGVLGLVSCGEADDGPNPDLCSRILDAERGGTGPEHVIIVEDTTASMTDIRAGVPEELASDLEQASIADGVVSVIAVDGAEAAPTLLAKRLPLSSEGERDRPSVKREAAQMPDCVAKRYLDRTRPKAPGTDLGRAVATAAELATSDTTIWMMTDYVWTSGDGALTADLLSKSPQEAAQVSAQAHGVDLAGAELKTVGVANTSSAIDPLHREWLRDYAQELCVAWGATGCESIELDPENFVSSPDGLPEDVVPPFPVTEETCTDEGRTFEVPTALLFSGDSAVLREAAEEALAGPIRLMLENASVEAEIIGHTASSARYTAQELLELSEARAASVSQALQRAGIDPSRLVTEGVGDTRPKAEDLDENGMQNGFAAAERRVEIVVKGVSEPCEGVPMN